MQGKRGLILIAIVLLCGLVFSWDAQARRSRRGGSQRPPDVTTSPGGKSKCAGRRKRRCRAAQPTPTPSPAPSSAPAAPQPTPTLPPLTTPRATIDTFSAPAGISIDQRLTDDGFVWVKRKDRPIDFKIKGGKIVYDSFTYIVDGYHLYAGTSQAYEVSVDATASITDNPGNRWKLLVRVTPDVYERTHYQCLYYMAYSPDPSQSMVSALRGINASGNTVGWMWLEQFKPIPKITAGEVHNIKMVTYLDDETNVVIECYLDGELLVHAVDSTPERILDPGFAGLGIKNDSPGSVITYDNYTLINYE